MTARKLLAATTAALALCWLTPAPAAAQPSLKEAILGDKELFKWDSVAVELGTFGIAGALVRFNSKNSTQELPYGIAIESARHGAMLSYRAAF